MANRNDWTKKFAHVGVQDVIAYLLTQNMATQTFAIDANSENVQTSGGAVAFLNGTFIAALSADAECDISAEAPYSDWAVSTSYTTTGTASEVVNSEGRHFVCIAAHTSYAYAHTTTASYKQVDSDEPGFGSNWRTYWRELDVWAEQGVGNSIAQDCIGYYLACALSTGVLRLFKAYSGTATASTAIVIPAYDPTRYIPVGLLRVAPTSGAHVLGTTSLTTVGTFYQLTGPVFPGPTVVDKN